jgi:2-polyprenyl-6-methoxyphenol hydroxylase-like FAD-dependent oxidoreductase
LGRHSHWRKWLALLERWCLDLKELKGTPLLQERGLIEDTSEIIFSLDHSYIEGEAGYQWLMVRRTRLYGALLGLAERTPDNKVPICIRNGAGIESIDTEKGTVQIARGDVMMADVIVVADGVFVSELTLLELVSKYLPEQAHLHY